MNVRFTLVAEGTTDVALMPILSWALRSDTRVKEIDAQFASPTRLPRTREGLAAKIRQALVLYPANLLFVHRDADAAGWDARREEIEREVAAAACAIPAAPVIPVRMMEAWLLIDEGAIRRAADNPRGTMDIGLPSRMAGIEREADPKSLLHDALRRACGHQGRRLAKFHSADRVGRIAELIDDFEPLRQLEAFRQFEYSLGVALTRLASGAR